MVFLRRSGNPFVNGRVPIAFIIALALLPAVSACESSEPHTLRVAHEDRSGLVAVSADDKEITFNVGPLVVAGSHHGPHAHHTLTPIDFEWPAEGWLRGYKVRLIDSRGAPLPRSILHHVVVVNYDRRQLIYPIMERVVGASVETEDVELPPFFGLPLDKGQRLGLYAAFSPTPVATDSIFLQVTLSWSAQRFPKLTSVLPLIVDVNYQAGESPAYDLPPGKSRRSYTFTMPVSGRVLAAAGHLHQNGTTLSLAREDGDSLVRLNAITDNQGQLTGISRKIFWNPFTAPRLLQSKKYTITAEYLNPTERSVPNGAMGQIYLVFIPDDWSALPGVNSFDPDYQKDLASVRRGGGSSGAH